MVRPYYERCKFEDYEDQILLNVVAEVKKVKGTSYRSYFKNVADLFNKKIKAKGHNKKKRRPQILKQRYDFLFGFPEKHQWTNDHEEKMLKMVSNGASWTDISRDTFFAESFFENSHIKKHFQTCQRMKLRAMSNYFLKCYIKHISDKTLQLILRKEEIMNLYAVGLLSQNQKQLILACKPFMMSTRMNNVSGRVCLRKKTAKEEIFKAFQMLDVGEKATKTIIKIDELIKRGQIKKNQKWEKSLEHESRVDIISTIYENSIDEKSENQNVFEEDQISSEKESSFIEFSEFILEKEKKESLWEKKKEKSEKCLTDVLKSEDLFESEDQFPLPLPDFNLPSPNFESDDEELDECLKRLFFRKEP